MEPKYWIWLAECFGTASITAHLLLEQFKTPEAIYRADEKVLQSCGILQPKQVQLIRLTSLLRAEQILKICHEEEIGLVCFGDERYPKSLTQVYAPPLVLYYQGQWQDFENNLAVAVVGTRYPTAGGAEMTRHFSAELAEAGAMIVSGFAIGIDTEAHYGALQANGVTVAVLSCGVDVDYPKVNADLKAQILQQGGLILSELPPKTETSEATKRYIPQRNRLLSGLSACILVGEAPLKSGVMHTVNHALEQGKEVFCLPPRDIYDPHFLGNLQFLQDGAIPVYRVKDLLLSYLPQYGNTLHEQKILGKIPMSVKIEEQAPFGNLPKPQSQASDEDQADFDTLSALHQQIVRALQEDAVSIDELSVMMTLAPFQLLCELTELELLGWIEPMAGNRYRRSRALRRKL